MYARVQMSWLRDNGLPVDVVTNTWHFSDLTSAPMDAGELEDVCDALNSFYNSLSGYYAAYMGTTRTMNGYDMLDAVPRAPVVEKSYTPTAPTNEGLPAELAICLSYAASPASGQPQARRRGRIYLGPLAQATLDAGGGTSDRRVNSATIAGIDTAYTALESAIDSIGTTWFHCVYSPTTDASASTEGSFLAVSSAYVDNAYDIQRRRGAETTTRTTIWP